MINENQRLLLTHFLDADMDYSYTYKGISEWVNLDLKTLKKDVKALRKMGYLTLDQLFDDEGFCAGRGYSITYEKRKEIKELISKVCFMCLAIKNCNFPFTIIDGEYCLDSEDCIEDENGDGLITINYCPVCGIHL